MIDEQLQTGCDCGLRRMSMARRCVRCRRHLPRYDAALGDTSLSCARIRRNARGLRWAGGSCADCAPTRPVWQRADRVKGGAAEIYSGAALRWPGPILQRVLHLDLFKPRLPGIASSYYGARRGLGQPAPPIGKLVHITVLRRTCGINSSLEALTTLESDSGRCIKRSPSQTDPKDAAP